MKTSKVRKVQLRVSVRPEIAQVIKAIAEDRGDSVSEVIASMIKKNLKNLKEMNDE